MVIENNNTTKAIISKILSYKILCYLIYQQNLMLSYNEIKQVYIAENETKQVCLAKNGIEQVSSAANLDNTNRKSCRRYKAYNRNSISSNNMSLIESSIDSNNNSNNIFPEIELNTNIAFDNLDTNMVEINPAFDDLEINILEHNFDSIVDKLKTYYCY